MNMHQVLVFCASSSGHAPVWIEGAKAVGRYIGSHGMNLVYGGGKIGLMGAVADATLAAGGEVVGVIPEFLDTVEVGHRELSQLHVVKTMHERKAMMSELSDVVIALPGGFGTMEELFEMLTWAQLNLHQKPIGLLNINGFYDKLLEFIEDMVSSGLLKPHNRDLLIVSENVEDLFFLLGEACNRLINKEDSDLESKF